MPRAHLSLALAVTLGACSGSTPPRASSPSPPSPAATADAAAAVVDAGLVDAGFAVVPLTLRPTGDAGAGAVVELRADGALVANGRPVGLVEPRRILGVSGREVLAVAPYGAVLVGGHAGSEGAAMQSDAAVVARTPDGRERRLLLDDDGTPVDQHPDGRRERAPVRFDAVPAEARGTAMLIVLAMLVPRQVAGEPSMPEVPQPDADASVPADDAATPDAATPDAGARRDAGRRLRDR